VAVQARDHRHRERLLGDGDQLATECEKRPAIEKILTHPGPDPQPPHKGRARDSGQDFAA
jgi:hypothetical protein